MVDILQDGMETATFSADAFSYTLGQTCKRIPVTLERFLAGSLEWESKLITSRWD